MEEKGRIAPVFSLLCDVSSSISNSCIKETFRTFHLLPKFDLQNRRSCFLCQKRWYSFQKFTKRGRNGKITSIDASIFTVTCLDGKKRKAKITQVISSTKQPFPVWDDPLDIKSNARITCNNAWCKIILKQTKDFSFLFKESSSKNVPATPGQKILLEDGFKLDIHNTRLARVEVESFHFKFVSKCIKHKIGQICIMCNSASFIGKHILFKCNAIDAIEHKVLTDKKLKECQVSRLIRGEKESVKIW